jgi:hypothetical protein
MSNLTQCNITIDDIRTTMFIIEELIKEDIDCANILIEFSKYEKIDYFPDFKIDYNIYQCTQHELFYCEK